MNNKTYSSFEEIDNEIRLLRLEKEIDKLSLTQQVSASAESLAPKNLLANTWVSLFFNKKRWINIDLEDGVKLIRINASSLNILYTTDGKIWTANAKR